jgi:hypothetical protein
MMLCGAGIIVCCVADILTGEICFYGCRTLPCALHCGGAMVKTGGLIWVSVRGVSKINATLL